MNNIYRVPSILVNALPVTDANISIPADAIVQFSAASVRPRHFHHDSKPAVVGQQMTHRVHPVLSRHQLERIRLRVEKREAVSVERRLKELGDMIQMSRADVREKISEIRFVLMATGASPQTIAEAYGKLIRVCTEASLGDVLFADLTGRTNGQPQTLFDDIRLFLERLSTNDFVSVFPGLVHSISEAGFLNRVESLMEVFGRRLGGLSNEAEKFSLTQSIARELAQVRIFHPQDRRLQTNSKTAETRLWNTWATNVHGDSREVASHYAHMMVLNLENNFQEAARVAQNVFREAQGVAEYLRPAAENIMRTARDQQLRRVFVVIDEVARCAGNQSCPISADWERLTGPQRTFALTESFKSALRNFLSHSSPDYLPVSWTDLLTDFRSYYDLRAHRGYPQDTHYVRLVDAFQETLRANTSRYHNDVATNVMDALWNLEGHVPAAMEALEAWLVEDSHYGVAELQKGLGKNARAIQLASMIVAQAIPAEDVRLHDDMVLWQREVGARESNGAAMRHLLTRESLLSMAGFIAVSLLASLTAGWVAGAILSAGEGAALRLVLPAVARELVRQAAVAGEILTYAEALSIATEAAATGGALSMIATSTSAMAVYGSGFVASKLAYGATGNLTAQVAEDIVMNPLLGKANPGFQSPTARVVAASSSARFLRNGVIGDGLRVRLPVPRLAGVRIAVKVDLTSPFRSFVNAGVIRYLQNFQSSQFSPAR